MVALSKEILSGLMIISGLIGCVFGQTMLPIVLFATAVFMMLV